MQTPCADVTGAESIGLLQVVSDPKTTVDQSLHAILVAELADNAGWEELIALAREMGQDDMTRQLEGRVGRRNGSISHACAAGTRRRHSPKPA